jgi:hypothetical protein
MKKIIFACALFSFFVLFNSAYATEDTTGEIANVEDTKAFKIGLQVTTAI